mmetsp:Transcript_17885/g.42051  ORF Transcript_17885/g.42051 Transcript_17885/m.42051 type:complete len:171 (+) Transcript_17885:109-621(+)
MQLAWSIHFALLITIGLTSSTHAARTSKAAENLAASEAEEGFQHVGERDKPGDKCSLWCDALGGPLKCIERRGDKRCRFAQGQPHDGQPEWCIVPNKEKDGWCVLSGLDEKCDYDDDCGVEGRSCSLRFDYTCKKSCRKRNGECPTCERDSDCFDNNCVEVGSVKRCIGE